MFFLVLIIAVSLVVVYSQVPRGLPEPKPPTLKDIVAPTAEEGRPIPVLFGTRVIKSPNVLWYGDLKYTKVTVTTSSGGK